MSEMRSAELEALYRTQAGRLRRILRAKFVCAPRAAGDGVPATQFALAGNDVDDLIQDVFARLLALGDRVQLENLREPIAYLVTVARHLVVDSIRRRQHTTPAELSSRGFDLGYLERAQLEEPELHERRVEAVAAYVTRLPPELSAAFNARFTSGMSQRDAASALGVTRRRVRTLEERLVAGAARELSASASRNDAVCGSLRTRAVGGTRFARGGR